MYSTLLRCTGRQCAVLVWTTLHCSGPSTHCAVAVAVAVYSSVQCIFWQWLGYNEAQGADGWPTYAGCVGPARCASCVGAELAAMCRSLGVPRTTGDADGAIKGMSWVGQVDRGGFGVAVWATGLMCFISHSNELTSKERPSYLILKSVSFILVVTNSIAKIV